MDANKTLIEKLKYIYNLELRHLKCNVMGLDINIDKFDNLITEIDIYVTFDYDGYIESSDPYSFSDSIRILLNKVRDCFTVYTPTKEGKLVEGDDNAYVSDAAIFKVEFEFDLKQIFSLSFKITYPD